MDRWSPETIPIDTWVARRFASIFGPATRSLRSIRFPEKGSVAAGRLDIIDLVHSSITKCWIKLVPSVETSEQKTWIDWRSQIKNEQTNKSFGRFYSSLWSSLYSSMTWDQMRVYFDHIYVNLCVLWLWFEAEKKRERKGISFFSFESIPDTKWMTDRLDQ